MDLRDQVLQFLSHPFPIWDAALADRLVKEKEASWEARGIPVGRSYSTLAALNKLPVACPARVEVVASENPTYLEQDASELESFCDAHGLELMTPEELQGAQALSKLQRAFALLSEIPGLERFLSILVRSIHVLRQDDPDVDCSYSHPKVPFSIFVSVCQDDSVASDLRVAESILHETLHLFLTLIEEVVPLVDEDSQATYFSPWKQENRNARGILHGVFVFRGVWEMLSFHSRNKKVAATYASISKRPSEIEVEFNLVSSDRLAESLSDQGSKLLGNLLPLS